MGPVRSRWKARELQTEPAFLQGHPKRFTPNSLRSPSIQKPQRLVPFENDPTAPFSLPGFPSCAKDRNQQHRLPFGSCLAKHPPQKEEKQAAETTTKTKAEQLGILVVRFRRVLKLPVFPWVKLVSFQAPSNAGNAGESS